MQKELLFPFKIVEIVHFIHVRKGSNIVLQKKISQHVLT